MTVLIKPQMIEGYKHPLQIEMPQCERVSFTPVCLSDLQRLLCCTSLFSFHYTIHQCALVAQGFSSYSQYVMDGFTMNLQCNPQQLPKPYSFLIHIFGF